MSQSKDDLQNPLARARGLGTARSGLHHWMVQRFTAVALIPLVIWFVASLVTLTGADHDTFVTWVRQPLTSVMLVLLLIAVFYHAALGLQTIVEDYVSRHGLRLAIIWTLNAVCFALGIAGVFAVLRLAL